MVSRRWSQRSRWMTTRFKELNSILRGWLNYYRPP
ncbi:MAG: hypothetical protein HWE39_09795 [Oceanospirillaceae bacterium]|nr:hypothetical protein [Oceanospirillaceae bacterium]